MRLNTSLRQSVVAALALWVGVCLPAAAQDRLTDLMSQLRAADPAAAQRLAREVELEWSRSGSAALNMLLQRGRDALEAEEYKTAAQHLTALTDHAPDFAEGWYARARAYVALDLYGPAIDDLGTALRLNPDHYQALYGLGAMFAELGDTRRAQEAFERALALHPHFEEAQEALDRLEAQGASRTL